MPTRILRDWTDSEPIAAAGEQGENLFARLLMKADDYGCYTAHPKILRSTCYPLRDDLRDADMTRRLAACEKAGLISVYEVTQTGVSRWLPAGELAGACALGAKRFLFVHNFGQRMRAARQRFPLPPPGPSPNGGAVDIPRHATDVGDSPQPAADRGDLRPESDADAHSESDAEAGAQSPGPAPEKKSSETNGRTEWKTRSGRV